MRNYQNLSSVAISLGNNLTSDAICKCEDFGLHSTLAVFFRDFLYLNLSLEEVFAPTSSVDLYPSDDGF